MSLRAVIVLTGVAAVVLAAATLALLAERDPSRAPIQPIDLSAAETPARDGAPPPPIFAPRDDEREDDPFDDFDDIDDIDGSREHGSDDDDLPAAERDAEDDRDGDDGD